MRKALIMGLVVVFAGGLLGACGDGDDGDENASDETTTTAAEPASVDVMGSEYKFEMPAQLTGDTFRFDLKNTGKEVHIAVVTKLAAGKTMADLQKGDPSALETVGGVASVDPGSAGNATFQVPPGSYIMGCFVPAPDGQPHIAKGMAFPFTVTAGTTAGDVPEGDVKLEGKEFSYNENPSFAAGETTVQFTNTGTQDHEITVIELGPGKTAADVGAFFANPGGPPPFKLQGGVAVKVGETGTTTVNFTKGGNYVFACLIPDEADGQAHMAKGMVAKVTVT